MALLVIESPYGPDECLQRIGQASEIDRPLISDWKLSHAVLARLRGRTIRLRLRRATFRNSFAPLFYGTLEASARGSVLRGSFRMHPFVTVFVVIWLGFAFLAGAVIAFSSFVSLVGHTGEVWDPWLGILVPLAMIAFGVGLLLVGRRLGELDRRELTAFLRSTLDGASPPSAAG